MWTGGRAATKTAVVSRMTIPTRSFFWRARIVRTRLDLEESLGLGAISGQSSIQGWESKNCMRCDRGPNYWGWRDKHPPSSSIASSQKIRAFPSKLEVYPSLNSPLPCPYNGPNAQCRIVNSTQAPRSEQIVREARNPRFEQPKAARDP